MSTLPMMRAAVLAATVLAARAAPAQSPWVLPPVKQLVAAGSEWEKYLRVLQLTGGVARLPWSVRSFGPEHLARLVPTDSTHPWHAREMIDLSPTRVAVVAPEMRVFYNSSFPFGYNDGPVWAGRGATAAVSAGLAVRYGPLSVTLAPTYFAAQNAGFTLTANGRTGDRRHADAHYPGNIDQPQRFGEETYARFDWGQSTASVSVVGLALGFSTANEYWGPAVEHPVLLGNNAPGFPHVFAGTSRPVDIWIGRIHGRVIWGRLEQSDYSAMAPPNDRRLGSGLVVTFSPRGVPGLELGGGRFFHTPWPADGLTSEHVLKPFEGFLKQTLATGDNPSGDVPEDNQLAAMFARWVFPASGFEVYGEYGREDHSWDARDFWLEPDHISAYTLGVQKAWPRASGIVVGRAELLNTRISHLRQVRGQSPMYIHGTMIQGHTNQGQILGSYGGAGGGASVIAADYYRAGGRWTASWSRVMRGEFRGGGDFDASKADVLHVIGVEGSVFRHGYDLFGGINAVQNFNRTPDRDAFNLNLSIGTRAHW